MKRIAPLAGMLVAFVALAIEPPKPAAAPPAKKPEPAQSEPAKAEPAKEPAPAAEDAAKPDEAAPDSDDEELPPLPPDTAPAGPPPQRFNPTEKVRADFPVSFPIDI